MALKWKLHNLFLLIHLCIYSGVSSTIERLELVMPRYAIRGGDVTLACEHNVSPEQLYKVEWHKSGNKIFQYIKGRRPPFRYYPTLGAELNKTYSNEKQVVLSKLDFSASGAYSCTVSTETPIFSKDSDIKDLTIIEPQEDNPQITFNKETYEYNDVLEANCTTSPSRPPPHITWLVNDEKVSDSLTKSLSTGYLDQKASSVKQLLVEVSKLHVGEDGDLRLTCMSTIPAYISHNGEYADLKKKSVKIEIEVSEGPVEAISNEKPSSSTCVIILDYTVILVAIVTKILRN